MAASQVSSARLSLPNVSQKHKNMSLHLGWLQRIPLFVCVVDVCTRWFVILMNLLPFYLFAPSSLLQCNVPLAVSLWGDCFIFAEPLHREGLV